LSTYAGKGEGKLAPDPVCTLLDDTMVYVVEPEGPDLKVVRWTVPGAPGGGNPQKGFMLSAGVGPLACPPACASSLGAPGGNSGEWVARFGGLDPPKSFMSISVKRDRMSSELPPAWRLVLYGPGCPAVSREKESMSSSSGSESPSTGGRGGGGRVLEKFRAGNSNVSRGSWSSVTSKAVSNK
jgi:hypothetical protein